MDDETTKSRVTHDANGKFAAGNPGRPPGARNRISRRIGLSLLRHYEENEAEILTRLMGGAQFALYMRLICRMLPQGPIEDEPAISPEDLERASRAVAAALNHSRAEAASAQQRAEDARCAGWGGERPARELTVAEWDASVAHLRGDGPT